MKRRKKIPQTALAQSIEWVKRLLESHTDPMVPAGERLRSIGKKLNVSRIEPGAVRATGFLKRLPDGSFAVYYDADSCSLARRRFTVAHELAHLVLEKFHKHVGREDTDLRGNDYRHELERAVDRIAAEILMPEALVIGLMKTECQLQRDNSPSGRVQKRFVLQAVGQSLGVSEQALVLRLLELPELLAVLLRVQWRNSQGSVRPSYFPVTYTRGYLRIVEGSFPDPSKLENEDGWEHQVHVQTKWGRRLIHCHAWRRPSNCTERGNAETWILGWAWNAFPLPAWDDSEHRGGTPDVTRLREFEASRGTCATTCRERRSSASPTRPSS